MTSINIDSQQSNEVDNTNRQEKSNFNEDAVNQHDQVQECINNGNSDDASKELTSINNGNATQQAQANGYKSRNNHASNDNNESDVDFIKKQLQENLKDRAFMLSVERDMVNLLSDPKSQSYKFPSMNPYFRMLVHRIAGYFNMAHNVDRQKESVVVYKTDQSKCPSINFQSIISLNNTAAASDNLHNSASTSGTSSTCLTPNGSSANLNGNGSGGAETNQSQQKRQILKREINDKEISNSQNRNYEIKSKTYEQKSAEYIRAKHRIFNNNNVNNNNNNNNNNTISNEATPTDLSGSDQAMNRQSDSSKNQQFVILNRKNNSNSATNSKKNGSNGKMTNESNANNQNSSNQDANNISAVSKVVSQPYVNTNTNCTNITANNNINNNNTTNNNNNISNNHLISNNNENTPPNYYYNYYASQNMTVPSGMMPLPYYQVPLQVNLKNTSNNSSVNFNNPSCIYPNQQFNAYTMQQPFSPNFNQQNQIQLQQPINYSPQITQNQLNNAQAQSHQQAVDSMMTTTAAATTTSTTTSTSTEMSNMQMQAQVQPPTGNSYYMMAIPPSITIPNSINYNQVQTYPLTTAFMPDSNQQQVLDPKDAPPPSSIPYMNNFPNMVLPPSQQQPNYFLHGQLPRSQVNMNLQPQFFNMQTAQSQMMARPLPNFKYQVVHNQQPNLILQPSVNNNQLSTYPMPPQQQLPPIQNQTFINTAPLQQQQNQPLGDPQQQQQQQQQQPPPPSAPRVNTSNSNLQNNIPLSSNTATNLAPSAYPPPHSAPLALNLNNQHNNINTPNDNNKPSYQKKAYNNNQNNSVNTQGNIHNLSHLNLITSTSPSANNVNNKYNHTQKSKPRKYAAENNGSIMTSNANTINHMMNIVQINKNGYLNNNVKQGNHTNAKDVSKNLNKHNNTSHPANVTSPSPIAHNNANGQMSSANKASNYVIYPNFYLQPPNQTLPQQMPLHLPMQMHGQANVQVTAENIIYNPQQQMMNYTMQNQQYQKQQMTGMTNNNFNKPYSNNSNQFNQNLNYMSSKVGSNFEYNKRQSNGYYSYAKNPSSNKRNSSNKEVDTTNTNRNVLSPNFSQLQLNDDEGKIAKNDTTSSSSSKTENEPVNENDDKSTHQIKTSLETIDAQVYNLKKNLTKKMLKDLLEPYVKSIDFKYKPSAKSNELDDENNSIINEQNVEVIIQFENESKLNEAFKLFNDKSKRESDKNFSNSDDNNNKSENNINFQQQQHESPFHLRQIRIY